MTRDSSEEPLHDARKTHSSAADERARYVALAAALLASGATGCTYTFGVYSGGLKHKFDLSQTQIDTIGQVTFLGGVLTVITGMINDRLGPSVTCALGGCLLTVIEVLYWLVGSGHINCNGNEEIALAVLSPCIQFCSGFVVAAVFTTLVRNFPRSRGAIVGLGKGWVGLFGGASTQVFSGLFFVPDKDDPKSVDYVLFCAVAIFCLTVLPAPFLRTVTKDSDEQARQGNWLLRRRLNLGFMCVVLAAAAVALAAILKPELGSKGHLVIAICILVLWVIIAPLVNLPAKWACPPEGAYSEEGYEAVASKDEEDGPPVRSERQRIQSEGQSRTSRATTSTVLTTSEADHYSGKAGEDAIEVGPELTTSQMVRTLDCWLMYAIATITIGGGTMLTTNLGQICDSVGYGSSASAISLFSVGQALSRMGTGLISDHLLIHYGVHRPLFLLVAPGFMALGQTVLLLASGDVTLYIGVLIAGIGFGAIWPLCVVLVSELFGRRNLGGNYMLYDGWCAALGSLGLAKFLPQSIYNSHKQPSTIAPSLPVPDPYGSGSSSGPECVGKECFEGTFAVIAGLAYGAILLCVFLAARNRKLYRGFIQYHREFAGEEEEVEEGPTQVEK